MTVRNKEIKYSPLSACVNITVGSIPQFEIDVEKGGGMRRGRE